MEQVHDLPPEQGATPRAAQRPQADSSTPPCEVNNSTTTGNSDGAASAATIGVRSSADSPTTAEENRVLGRLVRGCGELRFSATATDAPRQSAHDYYFDEMHPQKVHRASYAVRTVAITSETLRRRPAGASIEGSRCDTNDNDNGNSNDRETRRWGITTRRRSIAPQPFPTTKQYARVSREVA